MTEGPDAARAEPARGGSPGLKVIVGLGNPGREYAGTRHNAGWWLLDEVAASWGLGRFRAEKASAVAGGRRGADAVRLVKPLTYMNRSGAALAPYARLNVFDPARDLLVLVDDVALEPGRARMRPGGSAGGHNGLKSIEHALGTRDYARLRIGVGERPPEVDLAGWVLSPPPEDERAAMAALFPALVECVGLWADGDAEAAMNRCNTLHQQDR